jgi:hypothetical protein
MPKGCYTTSGQMLIPSFQRGRPKQHATHRESISIVQSLPIFLAFITNSMRGPFHFPVGKEKTADKTEVKVKTNKKLFHLPFPLECQFHVSARTISPFIYTLATIFE